MLQRAPQHATATGHCRPQQLQSSPFHSLFKPATIRRSPAMPTTTTFSPHPGQARNHPLQPNPRRSPFKLAAARCITPQAAVASRQPLKPATDRRNATQPAAICQKCIQP
jgi:hypothetical protein